MKTVFFTGIIHLAFSNTGLQKNFNVKESIDIAITNNIEVAQRGLGDRCRCDRKKAGKSRPVAFGKWKCLPWRKWRTKIDPFTNNYVNQKINYASYDLGSDLILFNGLTLQNAIRQNAFAYEASKMELQQAKDKLTLAVILAYLQVLSNEDQVEVANKQVAVTQVQIDRLEKLNKEGAINPPQLFDLKGQNKRS